MEPSDVTRVVDATISIVRTLGLPADEATVLQSSNKVALRVLPGDVMARVAQEGEADSAFEIELALELAERGCPVARLEPRVEPRAYVEDGFEVTLWTYYEPTDQELTPAAYADALVRLHAGMREVDVRTPHATDRVDEAEQIVASPARSPELADRDRDLLLGTLRRLRGVLRDGRNDQLLHGEPHPGNVLAMADGAVFIDLETCCRGPVEFDLAHVPESVVSHHPDVDRALLDDCRHLVLAMVTAWRWERGDQLPNGRWFGEALLDTLRAGPPWTTLDELTPPTRG